MKFYSNFDTSAFHCTSRGKWILFCAGLRHSYKVKYFFHFLLLWKKTYSNFDTGAFNCTSESNEYYYYYYISFMCRLQHIEMKCRTHVCCSIEETVSCLEQRPSTEIAPPNIRSSHNDVIASSASPKYLKCVVLQWRSEGLTQSWWNLLLVPQRLSSTYQHFKNLNV